jgi:chromosome segregation protein
VRERIRRLGAINLAAIEEYDATHERAVYMEAQHKDLSEALDALEGAIAKIDRESRDRFKETFDTVNNNLKELFPRVFGGGEAYLEMTSDDLLETGITIMARPPGKRNATIHLLSGGEKALTAMALVFSLFRLNPSPFCMLDEVDAPLDDSNVGRFCNLVKEMAKSVQFIYITHNKLTMEMADTMMGVTMKEPGVSRIVTVNIDEATELAQA